MNNLVMIGRTTKEPETKTFGSGAKSTSFMLAVERTYKRGTTDFIPCVAWGKTGEVIADHVHKGDKIAVTGSLESRSYEKDGEKRTIYEVNVREVEFLTAKKKEEPPKAPELVEEYYQPSIDEEDASMLPFSLE